ncbi:MAG: apolipoprotein N-acyltransferase [Bryobacteraceae bacterium]|jgi:apolipoprotein N-acyltransferase
MTRLPAPWIKYALALLTAVLLVVAFPPLNLVFLAPVALTPLLLALLWEPRPWHRFLLGYVAGNVYWFATCYWIQFVLEVHGGMGRWGGWGSFLLLSLIKSLHLAVFSMLAGALLPRWYAIPGVAALWTGIERTHGPLGFAWLALGNGGIDMALPMRLAPLVGVYGLSFLFALIAAGIALLIARRPRRELAWLAAVVVLVVLPPLPESHAGTETAVLVQPNIPEEAEWTPVAAEAAEHRLVNLTAAAAAAGNTNLMVWPESPGPFYYYADPGFREKVTALAREAHAWFVFGTVAETPAGQPLNSAVLLAPDGHLVDRYDKIFLVPFGEFIPPLFGWVNRISQEAGDFSSGQRVVVFPAGQDRLGTFICYESAFPHLVRRFAKQGANVLVNISNDGYFGHSVARQQHLLLVRMRAAENGRWILRATNDGITAVVDPAGRITGHLPMYQEATGRLKYSAEEGITPYTEFGDWFAWACLMAAAILLVVSQWPTYLADAPEVVKAKRGGKKAR